MQTPRDPFQTISSYLVNFAVFVVLLIALAGFILYEWHIHFP